MTRTDKARARAWTLLASGAVGLQLWAVYRPAVPLEPTIFPGLDKLGHLLIFAVPVLLILLAWEASRHQTRAPEAAIARGVSPGKEAAPEAESDSRAIAVVAGLFAAHAVVSELIQHTFYTHRSGDPFDVLADLVGIALGLAAFRGLQWRRNRRPVAQDVRR
jgi:hypothetical protein